MNKIRPLSDLYSCFDDISRMVHETQEPVFLTKNGYGDMVVMSMEAYENLRLRERCTSSSRKLKIKRPYRLGGFQVKKFCNSLWRQFKLNV